MQSVEEWLRELGHGHTFSRAIQHVLDVAIANPELASYASATDFAAAVGVNGATVTRAAQSLGFSGWPEWRQEIRARFLGLLTAPELVGVHDAQASEQPFDETLNRQIENLASIRKTINRDVVRRFAQAIAGANRRLVVASGSYAAAGRLLCHNAGIAGYRCELIDDAVAIANALGDLTSEDIVIPITFWRIYKTALAAAREARAKHAKVYLISDALGSPIANLADQVLVVPSEGASYFPSLLPSICVVEGICAELAAVNPDKSKSAISAAERQWQQFDLLYFNSLRSKASSE
ncbi:MurR/RpiR family transcriptional regulator [Microvirga sp. VF16]|uniref:MurR/RpiR family transcriptional regulator n=1 Tax=Microvirga sp. VF16 TaxID=2807101 RepID=UPI00193D13B6|nr:MurR/RpiR family transcriptional regulator [Microvirga sp. VF16]QRM32241.1 MurR/RpiR family transcriptional regulator [Microvirga sp. VF16]